ncbi:g1560 [Coccomyxa viridis]|uniref:G1560 protein n=1 Tax=Coccomyxa viridis TaxID=1274662 RepID=A0ABP1FNJ7_9CHLO
MGMGTSGNPADPGRHQPDCGEIPGPYDEKWYPGAHIVIAYAPLDDDQAGHPTMEHQIRLWLEPIQTGCSYLQQIPDRNLGQRMAAAMDKVLSSGTQKVVLIGSDCPDISESILQEAFAALQHHDVVFGPALDGGYYLVGLSQPPGKLFEGIHWSTSSVLQHSITQAHDLGLSCAAKLPSLQDLDTIQDLRTWMGTSSCTHPLHMHFKELLTTYKLLIQKG